MKCPISGHGECELRVVKELVQDGTKGRVRRIMECSTGECRWLSVEGTPSEHEACPALKMLRPRWGWKGATR